MAEVTALAGLVQRLALDARRVVAFRGGRPVSAETFLHRVRGWQAAFAKAPGQRYALHLEDSVEFAAALLGGWEAGKDMWLPADTLASNLRLLAACVDGFAGSMAGGLQPDETPPASIEAAPLSDAGSARLVLFTSGSSGEPQAVAKHLRQLDAEIATLEARFGAAAGDALVHGTVSHQHIYGLLFRVLWPLAAARRFAAERLEYPEQVAALAPETAVALVASPALLKRLPEGIDWTGARAALRVVFSSGGPLPAEASSQAERLWGRAPIEVFGSTETGGIASRQGVSAWTPLPGVDWRIEGDSLHVRSPHLADDAWHVTEDRARAGAAGFELLGRSDRIVKLEERRISLDAIERLLRADPRVGDARVLVLPGARERIGAVVVPSPEGNATLQSSGRKALADRLRDALRGRVDPIARPRHWRFVDAFPADAQGKATLARLSALFETRVPAPLWRSRNSESATLQLVPSGAWPVFDGHFPGAPILPGVAMIDWAIAWGREAFAIAAPFVRMEALKFQQLVRPETPLEVTLGWRAGTGALHFSFASAQGQHASGRIVFAERERAP